MKIATRKHWEIFLGFILVTLLTNVILDAVLGYFGYSPFDKLSRATNFLLTFPLYLSYPFLVGQDLNTRLNRQSKFKPTSTSSLIIPLSTLIVIYFIGLFYLDQNSPIWIIVLLMAINLFLMMKIFSFPARPLKSMELKRNAGLWEYTPEAFQFLCWPLGVWWTQPTINRLVTKEIIIEE